MSKLFFLSYARPPHQDAEHLEAVDRFFDDLCAKVAEKLTAKNASPGFRDKRHLEPGSPDWVEALKDAMREHPIGIVLLGPWYLSPTSGWCKWEHDYLLHRNALAARREGPETPRLLLVLNWVGTHPRDLPLNYPTNVQRVDEAIARGQDDLVEAVRFVNQRGLRETIALVTAGDASAKQNYERFTSVLAGYVHEQWRRWSGQPDREDLKPPVPDFDAANCWISPTPTNAREAPRARAEVKRKVKVVYVAAHPEEADDARAWRYRYEGESDWQPFALRPGAETDDAERIGAMVAALPEIQVDTVPVKYFAQNMGAELRSINRRYPVIFIVDPWSVGSRPEDYRTVLFRYKRLEKKMQSFASPVIVWNKDDPPQAEIAAKFAEVMGAAFDKHRW
jgi:hypothetical protein